MGAKLICLVGSAARNVRETDLSRKTAVLEYDLGILMHTGREQSLL